MARSKRRAPNKVVRSDAAQQDGQPAGGIATISVDPAGALDGDGTVPTPLAVKVDGTSIIINGSNELESTGSAIGLHAATHENGGSDEINVGGLSGVLADPQPPIIGATATTAVAGNDARLTNARTPTAHAASHLAAGSDPLSGLSPSQITGTAVVQSRQVAGHALSADVSIAAADLTNGVTGSGAVALAVSPALTGSPVAPTQTPKDNSTKIATTAYVENAVLGQNFKEACKYGTTAALPTVVYSNGSSGVGAKLTAFGFGALTFDGSTPAIGDRVLVKNQVATEQNGIYTVTIVGGVATLFVLTRATDFDQSADIETGDSAFVTAGTTLSATTWAYTGIDNPTIGTTSLTFVQTAGQGSFTAGDGIAITGNSIAVTADVERTTNKNAASGYAGLSAGSKLTGSQQTYGTIANTACEGNDARLSDSRAPTAHNVLSASHGDTLAAAVARGSLIVGNATPKWSALAIGAAARVLRSDGNDPSWAQLVLTTDVTGTLPVANGGTGLAAYTVGDLLYASAAGTLATLAAVAVNRVLVSGGVTTAPAWSATPTVTSITTTGAATVGGTFIVSNTGPHAIGAGGTTASIQFFLTGAFAPVAGNPVALQVGTTLTCVAGQDAYGVNMNPTLVEAGSGVHSILAALLIGPTITNGAATTGTAAGIYFSGFAAGAGTTTAAGLYINAAPTGATSNYSLFVAAGQARFNGNVGFGVDPTAALHVGTGVIYFAPTAGGASQGLQLDTAGLPNGSNGIFLNAPTGWTGNYLSANLNSSQQFYIDQTGVFAVNTGTAGAPTLTSRSDSDTGLYWDGSNGLYFATGGAQRLLITSGGRVQVAANGDATAPAFSNSGDTNTGCYFTGSDVFGIATGGTARVVIGPGVQVGAPTGGDKGAGTINVATNIYLNNALYANPDYVFEHYFTGQIERFKGNRGASGYKGLQPLNVLRTTLQGQFRFPQVAEQDSRGLVERFDINLELLEQAHLYILELHDRISRLEGDVSHG